MIPLLVRVLDRLADRNEQLQAGLERQPLFVAVLSDGRPLHELHDEIRTAGRLRNVDFGLRIRGGIQLVNPQSAIRHPQWHRSRVQNPGDIRMVQQGERLAFRFKAGDRLPRVQPRLDDL